MIIALEGVTADTQFEFEMMTHYEGPPADNRAEGELQRAMLPENYSTTLDILRRFSYGQLKIPRAVLN